MNIAGNASSELLNQVNENFQIDFEPLNISAAQFEVNLPRIVDEKDFRGNQENVEEFSNQIQDEISRTNQYSVESTITVVPNTKNFEVANLTTSVFN
jgi:hypothetical protein